MRLEEPLARIEVKHLNEEPWASGRYVLRLLLGILLSLRDFGPILVGFRRDIVLRRYTL